MQTVISKGARGVRTPKPAPRGAQCAALRPNKAAPLATVATGLANSPLAIADELPIEIPEIPDISQVIEAAASSGEISPLIAGAGVAGVAIVGTVIFSLTRGGSGADKIASTTAAQAYQALGAEERAVLVDIRMKSEQKDAGVPDLKATKKKLISLPFASVEDGRLVADAEFASKLAKQVEEDALVILLDGSGALAPKAASLVSAAGVGAKVYTVREGFKAWEASDLPVRSLTAPLFSLPSLDLSGLGNLEELASRYRKDPNALNTLMAAAAVAGGATLLLTEFETILELVGIVGAGKFLLDRLLFADERDKTLKEVKTLLKDKIALGEAGDDLKRLASTIIEAEDADTAVKALQEQQKEQPKAQQQKEQPKAQQKEEQPKEEPKVQPKEQPKAQPKVQQKVSQRP